MLRVAECQPDLGSICVFHTPIRSSAAPGTWRGCETWRDMLAPSEFRQLVAWGLGRGQRNGQLVSLLTDSPVGGLGMDSWWLPDDIFGVGSRGLLTDSHPADTLRDSKNNMVGMPPAGPPDNHVMRSTFLSASFLTRPGRWEGSVGGPSPGSDGGPPGAGLPTTRTVGGSGRGL